MKVMKLQDIKLGCIYYNELCGQRVDYRLIGMHNNRIIMEPIGINQHYVWDDHLERDFTKLNPDYVISISKGKDDAVISLSIKEDIIHMRKPCFSAYKNPGQPVFTVLSEAYDISNMDTINIGGYIMNSVVDIVTCIPQAYLTKNNITRTDLVKALEDLCIMGMVDMMYNIKEFDDIITNEEIMEDQLDTLQRCTTNKMSDITVVEYDKDIILTRIKTSYNLIRDKTNKLYLVSYIANGFYTPCVDVLDDDDITAILGHKLAK